MYIKSSIILACFLLGLDMSGQSQTDINVSKNRNRPLKTNINATYDYGGGVINSEFATKVSYELFRNSHFTVTANARCTSVKIDFKEDDLSIGLDPDEIGLNGTHLFGQAGFTSIFRSRLFGRPFMAMATLNSEWGEGGFAKVSGIGMGLIMLKANRDTQFGLGPLVMINTCSKMPAFLVFMYRHKFNELWKINLYGAMLSIDYTPTPNDLICMGADVDVKAFYFKPNGELLPDKCRFTSTSFRPMAKYRRKLTDNLSFGIQSGVRIKMACRANGVSGPKEYFKCRQNIDSFVQTNISYSL